ncbi:helix-turn-helix domain-containing protein [Streptomyces sp. NPDC006703]|uniref:helix-turn-helix domain-containing protein n=1 Tax=Streptomyces sp. NPDC006703 TaxID=3364759 RepID=UPI0036846745
MTERPSPHGPSCAKRIRAQGIANKWSPARIASEISACCQVSPLRAARLARGLTLRAAAVLLQETGATIGTHAPRTDAEQLRLYETGRHRPHAATLELLCHVYESTLESLGFAAVVPVIAGNRKAPSASSAEARGQAPPKGMRLDHLEDEMETVRRAINRTLAMTTVSTTQLDLLDLQINTARREYLYQPPLMMIRQLLRILGEVKELSADRQPASVQVRLSEMTACVSVLIADALMKLGKLDMSRSWYDTAQTAAEDSDNPELRARVRAQRAMLPYYYGPLAEAVGFAHEARLISRSRPTATGAFAAAAEARARARQGDVNGAEEAIGIARSVFERCDPGDEADAFAFPYRRLLLYLSGALTALGRTREARMVQEEAIVLYPERTGIDPALLRLETAICLARERSPAEACRLAGATVLRVPSGHRTPILEERARHVLGVLPPAVRQVREARELTEILALPPSRM